MSNVPDMPPAEDTTPDPANETPLPPAEAPADDPAPNLDETGGVPVAPPSEAVFVAETPAPATDNEEAAFQAEPTADTPVAFADPLDTTSPLPDEPVSAPVPVPVESPAEPVNEPASVPDSSGGIVSTLKQDAEQVSDVHEIHDDIAELVRDAHQKVTEIHTMVTDLKAGVDGVLENLPAFKDALEHHPLFKMLGGMFG